MGLKDISERCQHINFGMVLGMSTRKGNVKFLDDILADVRDKMHEVMRGNPDKYAQVEDPEKTADTLGISAVMVQDMTGKRINNYTFVRQVAVPVLIRVSRLLDSENLEERSCLKAAVLALFSCP